jgi:hypothetical protein
MSAHARQCRRIETPSNLEHDEELERPVVQPSFEIVELKIGHTETGLERRQLAAQWKLSTTWLTKGTVEDTQGRRNGAPLKRERC